MSNREDLRNQIFGGDTKKDVEVNGHSLQLDPISVGDLGDLQNDLEDPTISDMRAILSRIVKSTYTEEGELLFDEEDDLKKLLDRPLTDEFLRDLLDEFNRINDLDMNIQE